MNQFETEYKRCRPAMLRAAQRVAGKEVASQAVSEAALRLWPIAANIDYMNPNRVMGLFCTTARRLAINARKHAEYNAQDTAAWAEIAPPLSNNERDVERTIAVHRALAKLPPLEAHVAWHLWALEFSPQEILEDLQRNDGLDWSLGYFYRFIKRTVRPNLKAALLAVGADGL